jgi:hypothetical protein
MKNLLILLLATFGLWNGAAAQATGKISLEIVNPEQKPSPNTFVELLNAKDSTVVGYTTADRYGYAEFNNLKYGHYKVFIPQAGNNSYVSSPISIINPEEQYSLTIICKTTNRVVIMAHTLWYMHIGATGSVS